MWSRLLPSLIVLLTAPSAFAQVIVQQPVVSTFGGGTTVTVPDRGSMHLGSVNTARSGRVTTGPFRSGSSMGLERTGSSMSAGVYIHDLHEMDEAILAQGQHSALDAGLEPHAARLAARRNAGVEAMPVKPASPSVDRIAQASRYEKLARDAEAKGKKSVARLHWQMAAKHGSTLAPQKLVGAR